MIGRLRGTLLAKQPPLLWLDVGGIGYEIEAPMSTFYKLPEAGKPLLLHTHLAVREDAHLLYGFATAEEKALFRTVIRVSGVGAKIALAILSGISVDEFWRTVRDSDIAKLTRLPGIGKKTAERLCVELRDRAGGAEIDATLAAPSGPASPLQEARGALLALGYKAAEVHKFTDAVYEDDMTAEAIIREALKRAVR